MYTGDGIGSSVGEWKVTSNGYWISLRARKTLMRSWLHITLSLLKTAVDFKGTYCLVYKCDLNKARFLNDGVNRTFRLLHLQSMVYLNTKYTRDQYLHKQ